MQQLLTSFSLVQDFDTAYKVACLGVTEADWKNIAIEALQVHLGQCGHNHSVRLK